MVCVFLVLGSGVRVGLGLKVFVIFVFGLEEFWERKIFGELVWGRMVLV